MTEARAAAQTRDATELVSARQSRSFAWAGYAASGWAISYAVGVSGYQGMGGMLGLPGTFEDPDAVRWAGLVAGAGILLVGLASLAPTSRGSSGSVALPDEQRVRPSVRVRVPKRLGKLEKVSCRDLQRSERVPKIVEFDAREVSAPGSARFPSRSGSAIRVRRARWLTPWQAPSEAHGVSESRACGRRSLGGPRPSSA